MLKINMEFRKGVLFIRLKGSLTKNTVKSLNDYLIPVIIKQGIKYVVYNLGAVTIIDNYGKESLEKGIEAAKINHGDALICNTKLILDDKFKIVENELAALSLINI
ncbi:MAG: STAS domain-containing protein [Bacilli bacterium]|nr:STAS domain-containing protein [Bacilli bacterium]MDD4796034.1 STAS domain-containing protein [Bacilli bacterium]